MQQGCLRIKNTSSGPSLCVLKMIVDALTAKQDEMYEPLNKHREANIFLTPDFFFFKQQYILETLEFYEIQFPSKSHSDPCRSEN